jgi:uncharacterized LabA/DUF88 family protein
MTDASTSRERVGLFIDGIGLQKSAGVLQLDLDFKRLLTLFRQRGRLLRANYYTVLSADKESDSLRPLIDWLDYNGFNVVRRNLQRDNIDADMLSIAIDICVDAMQAADHLDHIVLFSGCRELQSLVRALKSKGRRVSVVSTLRGHIVADELRRQADAYVDLDELRELLCRQARGSVQP